MGNQREYLESGGFSEYLYEEHPEYQTFVYNGLTAKVLKLKTDEDGTHSGLPTYSNTSDIYLRLDRFGQVVQAKVYIDRQHTIDFDWGHPHHNKGEDSDKQFFPKGVVHVQSYSRIDSRDSNSARFMTQSEIEKYGDILRHFNPNVKFRP